MNSSDVRDVRRYLELCRACSLPPLLQRAYRDLSYDLCLMEIDPVEAKLQYINSRKQIEI